MFQCSTTPSSTAHLRWNHKKAAERELSLSPATQPRRSATTFLFCSAAGAAGRSSGHTCTHFSSGKNPEGLHAGTEHPPNTPLPGVLGQLSASLGHPVCWKTSDSCRRVARAANRSPCVGLIRALRCSCSSSVPAPPGAFLSRAFPPAALELCRAFFGYFGFSEGPGALLLAGDTGLSSPAGLGSGEGGGCRKGVLKKREPVTV